MPAEVRSEYPGAVPLRYLERAAGRLLRAAGLAEAELSVLLVADAAMAELNGRWLGRPWTTNVISFAQGEGGAPGAGLLGDVVLCVDAARREAEAGGVGLHRRLLELLVHGVVHLLGEDHEAGAAEARRMEARERALMDRLDKEGIMADLCINVDHVATVREARLAAEPDPVQAAVLVELAGADGVVVHLREDRRHIKDRDVRVLRQILKTRLTLEMAATDEMIAIASEIRPDIVTLVPEKRRELTTEGGLDVAAHEGHIREAVARLHDAGVPVSLFVDPEAAQVEAAGRTGADCVEIHTGRYAEARGAEARDREFEAVVAAARAARDLGLRVHAGHGLDYRNTARMASVSEIEEFSIGHAVVARAVLVGMERAVREMLALVKGC
ncbi:pyridoxine 5'-phosphate synthase [Dissulfurirhabdus thermomarina]